MLPLGARKEARIVYEHSRRAFAIVDGLVHNCGVIGMVVAMAANIKSNAPPSRIAHELRGSRNQF